MIYTVWVRQSSIKIEHEEESVRLHQIISQRVDQHDAHLTNLSALALASAEPQRDLILQVAGAIRKFYPRIVEIDLVPLSGNGPLISTRDDIRYQSAINQSIIGAAQQSKGQLVVVPSPAASTSYLLVKRSPNSDDARYGLALEIDAGKLVNTDRDYWQKETRSVSLSMPNGIVLADQKNFPDVDNAAWMTLAKTLNSRVQPLKLTTRVTPASGDIYPIGVFILELLISTLLVVVYHFATRLIGQNQQAEQRARLGEHGARIAHASRVNALGEMASGMAHELNQPLAALMSQNQAGVRVLAKRGTKDDVIDDIFKANVSQIKRASLILSRLRNWSKRSGGEQGPLRINEQISSVASLLTADAEQHAIKLILQPDAADPITFGDSVEIEQVIFNLTRNAIDAISHDGRAKGEIIIRTEMMKDEVIVEVIDNGPGITPDVESRLFEPFVTGKSDGMGLGLALCERIVDRMKGKVELSNGVNGGAVARVSLRRFHAKEALV